MKKIICIFRKTLASEYAFILFIKIFLVLVGVVRAGIWARYLGSQIKGTVEYIRSILSVVSIVITLGIPQSYPHFRKEIGHSALAVVFCRQFSKYMLFVLFVSAVISVAMLKLDYVLFLVFALLPISVGAQTYYYVYAIEEPKKSTIDILVINILDLLYSVILFLLIKPNVIVGASSLISIEIMQILFSLKRLHLFSDKHIPLDRPSLRSLVRYGYLPMVALLLTTLNYRVDVIMLSNYKAISSAEVGIYSVGIYIAEKIVIIPDTLKTVLASRLSKCKGAAEVAKLTRISALLSVFLSALFIIFGRLLVRMIYGESYADSYFIAVVNIVGVLFIMFFKLIAQYNNVNSRQNMNTIFLLLSIIINVVINIFLIPSFGVFGAAVGTCVSHIVCGCLFVYDFHKITGIPLREIIFVKFSDLIIM